jgi:hypothetical protein
MLNGSLKRLLNYLLFIVLVFTVTDCSSDKSVEPPPPTNVQIMVKSSIDSSAVSGANVVLYNANSGESILRVTSGSDGSAAFNDVGSGSFYVKIAAQNFKELPQGSVSPVPFSVSSGQTYSQSYFLDTLQGFYGQIDGNVEPAQSGFLVVSSSGSGGSELHSYSGPDGYFALFNVPFGTYEVYAVKSGYLADSKPGVTLNPGDPSANVKIKMNEIQGSTLKGMVTFLATENGIVDISILDKNSLSVINGLSTKIDSSRLYSVSNIPEGEYVAWASYKNDGYVMDPDWIFKNPGALNVTFTMDTITQLNFSVTNAITIISPTNPDDEIIPAEADSVVPTFKWVAYPQTKEYIIEVRDINGNLIWGGFDANGVIRHSPIPKEKTSIQFNFDGSALSELQSGQIYQWKIYADDDATANVQTLLSSSEDLKGIFITP